MSYKSYFRKQITGLKLAQPLIPAVLETLTHCVNDTSVCVIQLKPCQFIPVHLIQHVLEIRFSLHNQQCNRIRLLEIQLYSSSVIFDGAEISNVTNWLIETCSLLRTPVIWNNIKIIMDTYFIMLEPTKIVDVSRLCQRASSGFCLEFISETCKKACAYDLLSLALDTL